MDDKFGVFKFLVLADNKDEIINSEERKTTYISIQ